jgi:hypothetical protein
MQNRDSSLTIKLLKGSLREGNLSQIEYANSAVPLLIFDSVSVVDLKRAIWRGRLFVASDITIECRSEIIWAI